jgi:hypothetical protein
MSLLLYLKMLSHKYKSFSLKNLKTSHESEYVVSHMLTSYLANIANIDVTPN